MKIAFLGFALIAQGALFAQKGEFTIQGKIGAINAPAKVYLTYPRSNGGVVDSATVENGSFNFKGSVNEPVQGTILLNYLGSGTRGKLVHKKTVYLEPVSIEIKSTDSLSNAIISGSKVNADYDQLVLALKPSTQKMDVFMADYFAMPKEKQQDTAVRAVLDKKYNAIDQEQKAAYTAFIRSHSKSVVSLDALKKFGGSIPDYAVVAPLFESLSNSLKNTTAGKEYAEELAKLKATVVGAMAPDFTQRDTAGNMVSTASFRGKYLLVDFWASWCGPCRQENPNLVKAYAKYQQKGFEILGVSLDEERSKKNWFNAIKGDKLTWMQVSNLEGFNSEPAKLYVIRAIPQNALIDPSGKIIARNLRGEDLEKKLAELFQP